MIVKLNLHYELDLPNCKIEVIDKLIREILPQILADIYKAILIAFGVSYMKDELKPFKCDCGNNKKFIWKSRGGKKAKLTTITSLYGNFKIPQLQIQCKCCEVKMTITRRLLGLKPRQKISHEVRQKIALMGALGSYRCIQAIIRSFGTKISKSTVWKSVQLIGKTVEMGLDTNGLNSGMADGTGIPIQGIKKRGMELKVAAQDKIGGGFVSLL